MIRVIDLKALCEELIGNSYSGDGKVFAAHRHRIYAAMQAAYFGGYEFGCDSTRARIVDLINKDQKEDEEKDDVEG